MAETVGLNLLVLLLSFSCLRLGSSDTISQDAAALRALMNEWQNIPPSWTKSGDPCSSNKWDGIVCTNGRVTSLKLSSVNLKGTLSPDIGSLSQLVELDLSYNNGLGGPLTPQIANLQQLTTLILAGCSFIGQIPPELGKLSKLYFLALNTNKFSGPIPATLGQLSNLYWLDLAENQLSGPLPVSSSTSSGLDQLIKAKHFHLNKNQLSGSIDERLFGADMTLIHVLLDDNQLTGQIPASIGLVKSLQVLRLDKNRLTGPIPTSIRNLTNLNELHLAHNELTGALPDISTLSVLNYLDLSNNTFSVSEAPPWFSTLTSLTTLVLDNGGLAGAIPVEMFSFPQMQQISLSNNAFNGSLDMTGNLSSQLQVVNFENNRIISAEVNPTYRNTLLLAGNLLCLNKDTSASRMYCSSKLNNMKPYTTSLAKCGTSVCPSAQALNPGTCACAVPYKGVMIFRAPSFSDVTNSSLFKLLESTLWTALQLAPDSVYLSEIAFNDNSYLNVKVDLFPSNGKLFPYADIMRIGFQLSNQTYKPPKEFGPYLFSGYPYQFEGMSSSGTSISTGVIAGIAVGGIVLLIALIGITLYAVKKNKEAKEARERADPFASWGAGGKDDGSAPVLKGTRIFSLDELKKCTSNFSENHEIGSGGYGKVYRAVLPEGQVAAIKRAQQGSTQGALEFKTEIELLSRVHHKNLVSLIGFCYEQGEQMLVYEFIANGSLRENVIGAHQVRLGWKRRLQIALGSARGLAYLHDQADPPIIHRDIKSTNVLLDDNLNPKVADFGLSKLVSDSEKGIVSTQVKGTLGYLDPEYYMTQQLSDKSDVYSFGVVMLELVSARQPIENGKYIVREVKNAIDQYDQDYYGLKDIIDPVILHSAKGVGFRRFIQLAMECVDESASNRPRMNEVAREIEIILQNEGIRTSTNSASSSATDFGIAGAARHHPYEDQIPIINSNTGGFDSSSGYAYFAEPK